jgi:hypothetical protein
MAKSRKNQDQDPIKNAAPILAEEAYIFWGDSPESMKNAQAESAKSLDEFTGVQRAEASRRYGFNYSNLDTNISGRPGLTRSDYDYFRPDEAVPKRIKIILRRADDIYQRVGLVKNVIDLMGDFAAQGIRLVHKNKRIERFYRRWFQKVNGKDRSERFLNNLYKTGNIVINRQTGKLSLKVTDKLYQSMGSADMDITDIDQFKVEKREIPWKYTFIDPVYVEVAAGPLASFVTDKRYELQLPASLRKIISAPKSEAERTIVESLPAQILEAAKNKKAYPLDPNKTLVFHYKKDDWQAWSYPMIYAIMDDITVIEKLKLADMAALDGAISNIRIFKLGSLEHKIAPTRAAAAKLSNILESNVGGGTMDIVWGPDIELIESNTNVHHFLGEGKYIPHLNSVYAGLGIPPTLTGTFGAAGTTNNFISLKTLTQRLQYGREVLARFWEEEIALVQKSMGFKYPAKIEFDRMDLSSEDAEKALLIQLADRNLISDELLQTRFGFDPDMEKSRLNREHRERKSERMVGKSGPWFDPQFENSLKKISLQLGIATPSQVGLNLGKKKSGEKTAIEMKQLSSPTKLANDLQQSLPKESGEGRPKLSKDKTKRKEKTFSPQTGANIALWAASAQEDISNHINPIFLKFAKKDNLRQLTASEYTELETLKTKLLFSVKPYDNINENSLESNLASLNSPQINKALGTYKIWLKEIESKIDSPISTEQIKQAKSYFYSLVYSSSDTL